MKKIYETLFILVVTLPCFAQGIINNNGTIVSNGNINIVINDNGNWTDNGTFTSSTSDIVFIGNSNQSILGSSNTSFNKITLRKTSGDLLIGTNIYVTNKITLTSGDIDLQNSKVDLQSTGVIASETGSNRIKVGEPKTNTGTIQYTRTINNVTDFDPASLGILITTDQNLGSVTIIRGHKNLEGTGSFAGNYSIARYYEIPNIGELDGINTNIKFHYWEAELEANHPTEANLILYQEVDQLTDTYWTNLSTNLNVSNKIITPDANPYNSYIYGSAYSDINFNSKFTLGSFDTSLPVEILNFDARKNNNFVDINWQTITEINNDYFILEKSKDTKNWEYVTKIDGVGNSNSIINYEYKDFNPYSGVSYYRLKQVDYNGKYHLSELKPISFFYLSEITVYPNPCYGQLNIKGKINSENNILSIFTISGSCVMAIELNTEKELNSINLSKLEKGSYVIKIDHTLTKTIIYK